MERKEWVELTVLCLVKKGNQLLLQNRVKKDWQGYTLPGGHIEPGESVVDAVIREMHEETGLTILHPKLCGIKQFPSEDGRYLVFLFSASEFSGELCSGPEGKMEWIDREKLSGYNTVPDLDALLQVMEDERLTEFRYVMDNEKWKVCLK